MNKFEERLNRLRSLFSENKIDAFYISNSANVSYFTGKSGDDCALYITEQNAYIITDFRYREMVMEFTWLDYVETRMAYSVLDFITSRTETSVGIEKDYLPLSDFLAFSKINGKKFIPLEYMTEALRETKDSEEIENTRIACEIANKAFEHMLGVIKPGMTEIQLAAELEYFMRTNGAEGTSFDTILISGPKTSLPHGVPGQEKTEEGSFVLMDYGCKYNGYCSDMTRTVALGKPSQKMIDVYNIVLEAQLACCEQIKAGIIGADAHKIASDIIERYGYGEYFGHGLGHGTGLEIHEAPRYSPLWTKPVKEGSIVSIEPGIYLPKEFGVRIEDLALVTKNGIINFVHAPKELLII